MLLSIVAVVFGLGVIVLFHETGHFLMAKLVGLDIPRFSIGFPPHIIKKKVGGTEYCIGAIPLGGYVKVDLGTFGEPVTDISWFKRALVTIAGPLSNLILTAIIFVLIFGVVGWDVSIFPPVVGNSDNDLGLGVGDTLLSVNGEEVSSYSGVYDQFDLHPAGTLLAGTESGRIEVAYDVPPGTVPFAPYVPVVFDEVMIGMPAYEAGLRPGDSILTLDGKSVPIWNDYQRFVLSSSGTLEVVYSRGGEIDSAFVTPQEYDGRKLTGVTVQLPSERNILPFWTALSKGTGRAIRGASEVFTALVRLFGRPAELMQSSGGPVYVAETLTQQAKTGLASYLWTIATISLAIMIFNLLPIPILDGGQFIMLVLEGIRGKPISRKGAQFIQQAGVIIILMIFVLIMFKDISRVVTRVR